jgi:hypothetical protein
MACSGLQNFQGGLCFAGGRGIDVDIEERCNQIGILWINLLVRQRESNVSHFSVFNFERCTYWRNQAGSQGDVFF